MSELGNFGLEAIEGGGCLEGGGVIKNSATVSSTANMDLPHIYWEENSNMQHVKYESCNSNDEVPKLKEERSLYSCCDGNLNFATVACSEDDSEYGPYKKNKVSRQDPMSHRIIEKRRRDRMNNCLADLSRLIPADYLKKGRGRIEKTEIIEMAIKHMKYLQQNHRREEDIVSTTEHYRLGYHECLQETIRYLCEREGFFPREAICVKLINHLQKHCESITNESFLTKRHHLSQQQQQQPQMKDGSRGVSYPPEPVTPTNLLTNNTTNFTLNPTTRSVQHQQQQSTTAAPSGGDSSSYELYSNAAAARLSAEPSSTTHHHHIKDTNSNLIMDVASTKINGEPHKLHVNAKQLIPKVEYHRRHSTIKLLGEDSSTQYGCGSLSEGSVHGSRGRNVSENESEYINSASYKYKTNIKQRFQSQDMHASIENGARGHKRQRSSEEIYVNAGGGGGELVLMDTSRTSNSVVTMESSGSELQSSPSHSSPPGSEACTRISSESDLMNRNSPVGSSVSASTGNCKGAVLDGNFNVVVQRGGSGAASPNSAKHCQMQAVITGGTVTTSANGFAQGATRGLTTDSVAKNNFSVPVFVLHAKGSFYVPLTIDYNTLMPFLHNYNILDIHPVQNVVLHPVTINVNFQPNFVNTRPSKFKTELQNGWN